MSFYKGEKEFFPGIGKIQFEGRDYKFQARPGRWIGAKVGLYCNRHHSKNDSGWMEVDWFKISD